MSADFPVQWPGIGNQLIEMPGFGNQPIVITQLPGTGQIYEIPQAYMDYLREREARAEDQLEQFTLTFDTAGGRTYSRYSHRQRYENIYYERGICRAGSPAV